MLVNRNQSCLLSYGNAETDPSALRNDDDFVSPDTEGEFDVCFPSKSYGTLSINSDGTRVFMAVHGRSKKGGPQQYSLAVDVHSIDIAGGVWKPLGDEFGGLQPGESATLYLGTWTLTTASAKQQSKGCSAWGDFSDDVDAVTSAVGTAITVRRWTPDEQAAQDACE